MDRNAKAGMLIVTLLKITCSIIINNFFIQNSAELITAIKEIGGLSMFTYHKIR